MMKKEYYAAPTATLVLLTDDLLMKSDENNKIDIGSWENGDADIVFPMIPIP